MKVVIAGSRTGKFTDEDREWLDAKRLELPIEEVVHGAQTGIDTEADNWAKDRGIPSIAFHAAWDYLGPAAGPIRNRQMARYADAVILFPGDNGTASMRKEAMVAGRPIIYRVEDGSSRSDRKDERTTDLGGGQGEDVPTS